MSVVTVIAARNEADNIARVVKGALRYGDVLVVDNLSTDGTVWAAREAGADVLVHEQDRHIRQSYVDGFREVMGDYDRIVQMDAGGSHDPKYIPMLLRGLGSADVAITKRISFDNHLLYRIAMTGAAGWLIRRVTGMPYADPTSGFRAYRAEVLVALEELWEFDNLQATAHAFQFELLYCIWQHKFSVAEVSITYRGSGSSLKPWVVWEALRVLWTLRL